ncbi:MAG: S8 family serine peptidase [Actinomycetota bacterium]|nr:S8 family serine peptidase [Actinomycetota bacterium]
MLLLVRLKQIAPPAAMIAMVALSALIATEPFQTAAEPLQHSTPSPRIQLLDELTGQVVAGNIAATGVSPGYRKWLRKAGVDGSGVRVAVVDSGISPLHPDLDGDKVVARFDYGTPAEPIDSWGHGTYVASVLAGDPDITKELRDSNGFIYGLGIAPKAQLVSQNYAATSTQLGWPTYEEMAADSVSVDAYIWNASWSEFPAEIGYSDSEERLDRLVRDADPNRRGQQELLIVFAAGNDAQEGPSNPHEGKNVITVGGVGSGRGEFDLPVEPSSPDSISPNSTRGPTSDGRMFPTLVAPETWVAVARAPDSPIGGVVCYFVVPGASFYCSGGGTSMAAPHVSGAAALVHEWWRETFRGRPSPAMVKALLVASAQDIGKPNIPNVGEGWGRLSMKGLFTTRGDRFIDQSRTLGETGESFSDSFRLQPGHGPLKITLAWSDAPGTHNSRVLVNDLDLVLQKTNARGRARALWRGNNFRAGWSQQGGQSDRMNNLEAIYVESPKAGTYRVLVKATRLAGDGVLGSRDRSDQDFALVVRS